MSKLKYIPTSHPYYCCDSNYYSNKAEQEFKTWKEFHDVYNDDTDLDFNLVFRFDFRIKGNKIDSYPEYLEKESWTEDEVHDGDLYMAIYIMQQRHGKFVPAEIKTIVREDMPEIEKFLDRCYNHLKMLWNEFV